MNNVIYNKMISFNSIYKRNINNLSSIIYSINKIFNNGNNINISSIYYNHQLIKNFNSFNNNNNNKNNDNKNISNNNNNNNNKRNEKKASINSKIVDAYRNDNITEVTALLTPQNIKTYVR
jgi:hypothetical protein